MTYELTVQDISNIRETLINEVERSRFISSTSVMLGLVPYRDGNQWCVMYGNDFVINVVAFGDSPERAMLNFDLAWKERIK